MASKILLSAILTGEFKDFGSNSLKIDDSLTDDEFDSDIEDDLEYTQEEEKYLSNLNLDEKNQIDKLEEELLNYKKNDVPYRFKILNSTLDMSTKSLIIERLDQFYMMDSSDTEYHKLNRWLEGIMKVPFGKYSKPIVSLKHNIEEVPEFLNNTKSYLDDAVYGHEKYFNQKCIYFPNAYPDDLIFPIEGVKKNTNIGFCGNWLNRIQWIDLIEKNNIPVKKDIFVIGDDMVKSINSYKIHFNRNLSDDINFRTFETLGCKTLLITNHTPGLEKLFTIGENIVVYENEKDLIDKINFYLKNNKEREVMIQKGYDHVKKNHTYYNRAEQLINIVKDHG